LKLMLAERVVGRNGYDRARLVSLEGEAVLKYVVITDVVTEAERDEYLRLFSHRPVWPGEAIQWPQ